MRLLYSNNEVPAGMRVTNTTTKTPLTGLVQLPQSDYYTGSLMDGSGYRIDGYGYLSTKASSPGNLTITVDVAGISVITTGPIAVGTSLSNQPFKFDANILFAETSTAGKVIAGGMFMFGNLMYGMVNTGLDAASQIAVGNLTLASKDLTVSAQWQTADVANIITFSSLFMTRVA